MQIDITHLTRRYGKVTALDDLTVSLRPGCITGLVGPNGAGKSTLLRLMAGRESADGGDITYDGVSVMTHPEELLPHIGLMPDSLPEACKERVIDYLDFYARAGGLKGEARLEREDDVMEFTQAQELQTRRLDELSKGMKQRISLARVLMTSPQVLLLDEPAAGLDPRARVDLRNDLRKLAERHITIIISSHILADLEDICDDVVILEQGRLRRQGAIGELERMAPAAPAAEGATAGEAPSGTPITLHFVQLDQQILSRLAALPGYKSLKHTGRRTVEVTVENVDAFMAALFAAGLPVTAFSRNTRSLEDVFIESTTGAVQ